MSVRKIAEAATLFVVSLIAACPACACGPWFSKVLSATSNEELLVGPTAIFEEELKRIDPPVPVRFKAVRRRYTDKYRRSLESYAKQTADVDLSDLRRALASTTLNENEKRTVLTQVRAVRDVLRKASDEYEKRKHEAVDGKPLKRPIFVVGALPAGLPAEFADYLRGAILYHRGQTDEAGKVWLGLLARPMKERHWRSTWAAFMMGKTLLEDHPAEAAAYFQHVRKLAAEGYADSLGLASASYGWEAKSLLERKEYNEAVELYVVQRLSGDPTATPSLQRTARRILDAPDKTLARAAGNVTVRRVVTAYVLANGGPYSWNYYDARGWNYNDALGRGWVAAVEAAKVSVAKDADRLAWAAYNAGKMDLAKRWVALAPKTSPMTRWIRSKLLLREGNVTAAMADLSFVIRRVPVDRRGSGATTADGHILWLANESLPERVRGELGALKLSRSDYFGALGLFYVGGYWDDAAYVAECVLTPDELIVYVNAKHPPGKDSGMAYVSRSGHQRSKRDLRHLLARRLTRLGRTREARKYFPSKWRPRLDAYVRAVKKGNDTRLDDDVRAAHLWKAACILRYEGMQLLGTELEPDGFITGGGFSPGVPRWAHLPESHDFFKDRTRLVPVTRDEFLRERRHRVTPYTRFHYRYLACEHAWRAAELMPDNSDATARVLCIAGTWMMARDPLYADRFYKALVTRCRRTKLGEEADRLRWFPKIEISREKLLE